MTVHAFSTPKQCPDSHRTGGAVARVKRQAPERVPIAIDRFHAEAERTLAVLNSLLASRRYTGGEIYTIADIAHFGRPWRREFAGVDFGKNPNVARWYDSVSARPAVLRAIARVTALVPPA
jgi:GST-like protein